MDIKNVVGELNPYTKQKVQETKRTRSSDTSAGTSGDSGDSVQLSSEARLRGAALTEAGRSSDVRSERVQELKEQVRNGTYQPDIKKAAANLIRDDLSLLA